MAWKFRILEAKAALWRGLYEKTLELLSSQPGPTGEIPLKLPILTLQATADTRLQHFAEAEANLKQAEDFCQTATEFACGEVIQARGLLSSERGDLIEARRQFENCLLFARARGDRFLESTALLNLGSISLKQERFDEAIESSEASYQISRAISAGDVALVAQGNLGWAYYKLGDPEKALEAFQATEERAAQLGDVFDQENELTNIGYIQMDAARFDLAATSFQRSLDLATSIDAKQDIYNALRVLARLSVVTGNLEKATNYAGRATESARQSGNRADELYPKYVQAQVELLRGNATAAASHFQEIVGDAACPIFLKWEAQHSLALLYEDEARRADANLEYLSAIATFESARHTIHLEDSQLSFLSNATHLYDDYIHFLVTQGKTDTALQWADNSRARTLAEGLGLLRNESSSKLRPLNPQQTAKNAHATILFYWLGEKQSYLWAITAQKTRLFTLPPGTEVDAAVSRYRRALAGPQDVLEANDPDGLWLYRTLIAPAQNSLKKDAKIIVIPDGSLNNLNFETLLVPAVDARPAKHAVTTADNSKSYPHYWIEDDIITDASSLRLLGAARSGTGRTADGKKRERSLMLFGNSVAPNDKYPELPQATAQMQTVARHFPAAAKRIISRESATPAAYLASNPEQFSYIHFVAHGTARRLSPLDSAIVLSKPALAAATTAAKDVLVGGESDSFKLYARDIIRRPLRAELVTISACHGADGRAYSGEGLVGLSWAFLRAGARHVVAALWEVTDASTPELMDKFYDELQRGAAPDAALRAAKLSLLRGGRFRNPYYWAPFQLYVGS